MSDLFDDMLDVFLGDDEDPGDPVSRPAVKQRAHKRPRGYAPYNPQPKTRVILDQVQAVLEEYEDHLPMTIRQVFYRLVGVFGYPKDELAYERLCEYLNRARRAKMIPMEALRDDGVTVLGSRFYDGVEEFWDDVGRRARDYRINRQKDQCQYVELWCEAAGMQPQLQEVADDFAVRVYSNSGFVSIPAVRVMVEHALTRNVPTVILHVGDLDPSGDSIFTAMTKDAAAFVEADRVLHTQRIVPVRVALTGAQVVQYRLPTAPPKKRKDGSYADSRATKWLQTPDAILAGGTVQCEALAPDDLAAIVRDALEEQFDMDQVAVHVETEERQRTQLLRALPRGGSS